MHKNKLPERLDRKTIYESDWLTLYLDKVQMPDGQLIDSYHYLHYPKESVSVVIFNQDNEIMLIQSKRYVTSRLEWEVPAGGIESGESPEDAARRECMEECGCDLKDLTYLCCHYPNNGMSDLKVHVYAAKVHTELDQIDTNEVSDKKWFSKEEVLDMLKENEIQCGVSMLALLYAMNFIIK